MALLDIAFLHDFIKDHGFWPLTLICMLPMLIFTVYVKVYDAREAKAHTKDGHGH